MCRYGYMLGKRRDKNTFFIDPDNNNPRAEHVYEKAGFVSGRVYTRQEVSGFFRQ